MAEETQGTQEAAEKKNKKVNKLKKELISSKIEELEKGKQTASKYYKHLLQRKMELEQKVS